VTYEAVPERTCAAWGAAVEAGEPDAARLAALGAALYGDDPACAGALALRLAADPDEVVRGNALLAFGHLARRFGRLDLARARPVIAAALGDPSAYVRGQAESAADDVAHFLGVAVRP
jgi:HEAT repeat protein